MYEEAASLGIDLMGYDDSIDSSGIKGVKIPFDLNIIIIINCKCSELYR